MGHGDADLQSCLEHGDQNTVDIDISPEKNGVCLQAPVVCRRSTDDRNTSKGFGLQHLQQLIAAGVVLPCIAGRK